MKLTTDRLDKVPNGNVFRHEGEWFVKLGQESNSAVKAFELQGRERRERYFRCFTEVEHMEFSALPVFLLD